MTVAWINPKEPVVLNHYICNVCSKDFVCNEESGYREKMKGEGYAAYEEIFYVCSNECRQIEKDKKLFHKF